VAREAALCALLMAFVMLGVGGCNGGASGPSEICQQFYDSRLRSVQEGEPNYRGIVVEILPTRSYLRRGVEERDRPIVVRGGPVEGSPFHTTYLAATPSDCVPVFWRTGEEAGHSELRLNMRVSLWIQSVAQAGYEPDDAALSGVRIDFPPSPSHSRR
jgi:hypothetical protein